MSYDISLLDPITQEVIEFDEPHQMAGGIVAVGGTRLAELNVTYNYSRHFYRTMGENGIRTIYGKSGAESMPILRNAINQLAKDKTNNYWEPTEGNARSALVMLLALATIRPDGIWNGD